MQFEGAKFNMLYIKNNSYNQGKHFFTFSALNLNQNAKCVIILREAKFWFRTNTFLVNFFWKLMNIIFDSFFSDTFFFNIESDAVRAIRSIVHYLLFWNFFIDELLPCFGSLCCCMIQNRIFFRSISFLAVNISSTVTPRNTPATYWWLSNAGA